MIISKVLPRLQTDQLTYPTWFDNRLPTNYRNNRRPSYEGLNEKTHRYVHIDLRDLNSSVLSYGDSKARNQTKCDLSYTGVHGGRVFSVLRWGYLHRPNIVAHELIKYVGISGHISDLLYIEAPGTRMLSVSSHGFYFAAHSAPNSRRRCHACGSSLPGMRKCRVTWRRYANAFSRRTASNLLLIWFMGQCIQIFVYHLLRLTYCLYTG